MQMKYNHIFDIIMADPQLTHTQKSVLKLLVGLTNKNRNYLVSISSSLIAKKLGIDESTAKRSINKLRALKYIELERSKGVYDGKSYNCYKVFEAPSDWYVDQLQFMRKREKRVIPESAQLAHAISVLVKIGGVDSRSAQKLLSDSLAKKDKKITTLKNLQKRRAARVLALSKT
jgi:predicted ArsR family transcriptional regulator